MRIARRGRPGRFIGSLVAIAALWAMGCASRVEVGFDAREGFTRFRSWAWRETDAARITGPDVRALAGRAATRIALALEQRGFVHDPQAPDFTVAFELTLEPRLEKVGVPSAPYFLSSQDHSPSYWIEGTNVVERRVEDFGLRIDVALPDGRVVWKGAVRERLENAAPPPLDEAIEQLLLRLPPPSRALPPSEVPPQLAQLRN